MMTFYDSSAATVRSESPGSTFSETAYGLVSVQNLMALKRKRFCVEQRDSAVNLNDGLAGARPALGRMGPIK